MLIFSVIVIIVITITAYSFFRKKDGSSDNLGQICSLYEQGRLIEIAKIHNLTLNEKRLVAILLDKYVIKEKKAKTRRLFAPELNAIMGQIEMAIALISEKEAALAGREKFDDTVKRLLGEVSASAAKLMQDIRAVQEIEAQNIDEIAITADAYDVNTLIEVVEAEYKDTAVAKNIVLEVTPTEDIAIFVDMDVAVNALKEVLDNAVKYTPQNGKVTIAAMRHESMCRIDVTDTGPGIAFEELNSIFVKFWRSPSVKSIEGLGLGLFRAKKLLNALGGYIRFVSSKGHGATFSVFVPLSQ